MLDTSDTWIPEGVTGRADPRALAEFLERIERSPEWRKVYEQNGVLVFRKAVT